MEGIQRTSEIPEFPPRKPEAEELRAFWSEIAAVAQREKERGTAHFSEDFDPRELTLEDRTIWREFQELERRQKLVFSGEEIAKFKKIYDEYEEGVWAADFDEKNEEKIT